MNEVMASNVVLVVVNLLGLSALLLVYGRMLRQVRTTLTIGLLAFAFVLWVQNAVQLYFFATMMTYYASGIDGLVLVQNLLATIASLFLLGVTLFPVGFARAKGTPAPKD